VGEGTDLRFDNSSGLAGGALRARDRIVHLVAFAMAEPTLGSSAKKLCVSTGFPQICEFLIVFDGR